MQNAEPIQAVVGPSSNEEILIWENISFVQGKYGSSITTWRKKSVYKSKLSPCPTTHRLNMTRPSQVVSKHKPRYLKHFTFSRGLPLTMIVNLSLLERLLEMHIDLDLATFIIRWFEEIHSQMRSTSSCRSCMSEEELRGLKSRMSSA